MVSQADRPIPQVAISVAARPARTNTQPKCLAGRRCWRQFRESADHRLLAPAGLSGRRADDSVDLFGQRMDLPGQVGALIDGGAQTQLSAADAALMLRRVRPATASQAVLRTVAVDLVGEVRRLDTRIVAADKQIATVVAGTGTTLTELYGIGPIVAGKILAHVGTVRRFDSPAAFASFNGTAPIEVSSGDVVRHRLSRAGDRRLNHALHMMAITQLSGTTHGPRLLPTQTRRRQEPQGSAALPKEAPI
jgi:Transposase IS116/IS110/IS902 family